MSGTIVVDRIESDASYASSINIASPIQISNTITGNVNFDSGTMFVDAVNNRVGVGGITNPSDPLHVVKSSGTTIGRFQHTTTNGGNIAIQTPSYEIAFGIDSSGGAYVNTGSANRLFVDASGRVTMPYQPAFLASRTGSNQTSMASLTTCIFNTEVYDEGGNYNPSTGVFTAPVTGKYLFTAVTLFTSLTSGQEIDAVLTTSNRNYYAAPGRLEVAIGVTWSNDYIAFGYYQIADMDANDTASIYITSISTGTIALHAGAEWSRFAGYLLG